MKYIGRVSSPSSLYFFLQFNPPLIVHRHRLWRRRPIFLHNRHHKVRKLDSESEIRKHKKNTAKLY